MKYISMHMNWKFSISKQESKTTSINIFQKHSRARKFPKSHFNVRFQRHSYRPPAYRCRNLLAALDHNGHTERPVLTNKDGTVR